MSVCEEPSKTYICIFLRQCWSGSFAISFHFHLAKCPFPVPCKLNKPIQGPLATILQGTREGHQEEKEGRRERRES